MLLTEDEKNDIDYQLYYLGENVSETDRNLFMEDYLRSPILALYLVEHKYFHRKHMIDSIVLEALAKGTMYKGNEKLNKALDIHTNGSHVIQITIYGFETKDNIEAYHVNSSEWSLLNQFTQMEKRYGDKFEGSEYEIKTFTNAEDIELKHCSAGAFISSNENVYGNCYSEDCDTYGTSKAQNAYIYWITDQEKYGVIYHSYWCM